MSEQQLTLQPKITIVVNFFVPNDIYYKRTDATYWPEPVNALTNLCFIFAALWGWRIYRQRVRAIDHDWLIPKGRKNAPYDRDLYSF